MNGNFCHEESQSHVLMRETEFLFRMLFIVHRHSAFAHRQLSNNCLRVERNDDKTISKLRILVSRILMTIETKKKNREIQNFASELNSGSINKR